MVTAQADSRQRVLAGRGEGSRVLQVGLSEASVLLRRIQSFSDPRLYALSMVAPELAHSEQPLLPERVLMAGAGGQPRGGRRQRGSVRPAGVVDQPDGGRDVGFSGVRGRRQHAARALADRMSKQAMTGHAGDDSPDDGPKAVAADVSATARA